MKKLKRYGIGLVLGLLLLPITFIGSLADNHFELSGNIESITTSTVTIQGEVLNLNKDSHVFLDGNRITDVTALKIGQFAVANGETTPDRKIVHVITAQTDKADKIYKDTFEEEGQISQVGNNTITVNNKVFEVDSKTEIYDKNNKRVKFDKLEIGQNVKIKAYMKNNKNMASVINL